MGTLFDYGNLYKDSEGGFSHSLTHSLCLSQEHTPRDSLALSPVNHHLLGTTQQGVLSPPTTRPLYTCVDVNWRCV